MECLNCKKEFKEKRGTAKYCSVNCRVAWNKKNGNKKPISGIQTQVLYNAVLEMVNKISDLTKGTNLIEPFKQPQTNYPINTQKHNIIRSYEYYFQAKRNCENEDDWAKIKEEILNSDLTSKQKALLTAT